MANNRRAACYTFWRWLRKPTWAQAAVTGQLQENQRSVNRFAGAWLGELPVPFPKNYVLGVDTQQRSFEHYGRPTYLRGEWRDRGWWYYYLYAALIKAPPGLWALGGLCLLLAVWGVRAAAARDTLILLTPAVVVFCVVSSKTGFSEHFRYVLPVFPFLFIWVGGFAERILLVVNQNMLDRRRLSGKTTTANTDRRHE